MLKHRKLGISKECRSMCIFLLVLQGGVCEYVRRVGGLVPGEEVVAPAPGGGLGKRFALP
jgi:hypothetical protein